MDHSKQIEAAENAQAASLKAQFDAANYMTVEERAAAERARLFSTLKAHDMLGVYFGMYADDRPSSRQSARDNDGRER